MTDLRYIFLLIVVYLVPPPSGSGSHGALWAQIPAHDSPGSRSSVKDLDLLPNSHVPSSEAFAPLLYTQPDTARQLKGLTLTGKAAVQRFASSDQLSHCDSVGTPWLLFIVVTTDLQSKAVFRSLLSKDRVSDRMAVPMRISVLDPYAGQTTYTTDRQALVSQVEMIGRVPLGSSAVGSPQASIVAALEALRTLPGPRFVVLVEADGRDLDDVGLAPLLQAAAARFYILDLSGPSRFQAGRSYTADLASATGGTTSTSLQDILADIGKRREDGNHVARGDSGELESGIDQLSNRAVKLGVIFGAPMGLADLACGTTYVDQLTRSCNGSTGSDVRMIKERAYVFRVRNSAAVKVVAVTQIKQVYTTASFYDLFKDETINSYVSADSVDIDLPESAHELLLEKVYSVLPGRYSHVFIQQGSCGASLDERISIPAVQDGEISLSSVVLGHLLLEPSSQPQTHLLRRSGIDQSHELQAEYLNVAGMEMLPSVDGTFIRDDKIDIILRVYLPDAVSIKRLESGEASVIVAPELGRGGIRLQPQFVVDGSPGVVLIAHLAVTASALQQGNYSLTVRVRPQGLKTGAAARATFRIQ